MPEWLENLFYNASRSIMNLGRGSGHVSDQEQPKYKFNKFGEKYQSKPRDEEPQESTAQATYLLPRSLQRKKFLEHGYLEGTPNDYGLVRAAVGNNNFPIFQTAPDQITRDQLVPIGNDRDFSHKIPEGTELQHAGYYPSAFYVGQDFKIYRKDWDLNDYGNSTGRAGTQYRSYGRQLSANLIDKIGSPVVVTTGFQPVLENTYTESNPEQITLYDMYERNNPMAIKFVKDRGLVPFYEEVPMKNPYGDGYLIDVITNKPLTTKKLTMFTSPEVIVEGHK